jgi:hypothetical protein
MSQIIMNSETSRVLVQKALLSLVLEESFIAVASLAFVVVAWSHLTFAWSIVGSTVFGVGALISAVGFYAMMRTYSRQPLAPEPALD